MGDFHLTIEDMVVDGDKLWVRMTGRGVHRAPSAGVPATSKSFAITVFDVCRFEHGKIVALGRARPLRSRASRSAVPESRRIRARRAAVWPSKTAKLPNLLMGAPIK